MNSLNLPTQMAANEAKMRMMPVTAATDAAVDAQRGLQFFKQRPGMPQLSRLPQHQAVPGTGEILMQAGANLMGGYMQNQANTQYLDALKDIEKIRAGGSAQATNPAPAGMFNLPKPPR